jgi:hypothetical protein
MSLFNVARFGKSVSLFDYQHFGSSMSVRGIVRLGSGLSLFGNLNNGGLSNFIKSDGTVGAYAKQDSSDLKIYVGGTRAITFETDGGILHGQWNADNAISTSDRRLKTHIMPLQRTLRDVIAPRGEKKAPTSAAGANATAVAQANGGKAASGDGALWLLRQLRPVSYSFRKGFDSKYMRFGFIADELESVVPEVVRNTKDRDVPDQKGVVYQDLIALLAAASQSQQKMIESLETMQLRMMDEIMKLSAHQAKLDREEEELKKKQQEEEELEKKTKKVKLRRRKRKRSVVKV